MLLSSQSGPLGLFGLLRCFNYIVCSTQLLCWQSVSNVNPYLQGFQYHRQRSDFFSRLNTYLRCELFVLLGVQCKNRFQAEYAYQHGSITKIPRCSIAVAVCHFANRTPICMFIVLGQRRRRLKSSELKPCS